MLHHESHEFGRVTPYAEELEAILFDKGLESCMRCDADSVAVRFFEDLSKGNEGLDVATRSNDLDDNIESWGSFLARLTCETGQCVHWW